MASHSSPPKTCKYTTAAPFLGFNHCGAQEAFGLAGRAWRAAAADQRPQPVLHTGKSHMVTIGATGSGKTNLLIANLLLYTGSAIVVDIRGDAVRATERFRRVELGQKTYVLDPFGVTGHPSDRLDPLDIAMLADIEPESEAQTIAASLMADHHFSRDPFWHTSAGNLIGSNIAHAMTQPDLSKRTMNWLLDTLYCDDVVYHQAVLLDTVVKKGTFAYGGIAAFLQLPDNNAGTRASVLATAHTALNVFRSRSVRAALGPSTIDLADLLHGKPMTIYLVLPIQRLASHGLVLKLWLEVLLQVLMRRTRMLAAPTLVAVDECAQIGRSPAVMTVATYLRAAGVRLWTMWQDLSQIKALYPTDWQTLVNNTSALTFLPGNDLAAQELAALLGLSSTTISSLADEEQLICETGAPPRKVRMAQYWKDRIFEGRHDPVPRYESLAIESSR